MISRIKLALYFTVARYFRFFARLRLLRWKPRIVIVTGSNGKTMALHFLALQLGPAAKYSFNANSAIGVPFDILGLKRKSFLPIEWIWLFLAAPICALKGPYPEKIYVVEADGDRPGEGDFFGPFLQPEVCVWLSAARTHTMLFEDIANERGFKSIDEAIAYEFSCFITHASKLVIVNADMPLIARYSTRARAPVFEIKEAGSLSRHEVSFAGSEFTIEGIDYRLPFLLPKETFYAIKASLKIAEYFGVRTTRDLSSLVVPPGRSSVFRGVKNTTLVDSSYNVNADSVIAIVNMAEKLPGERWLILGDLTEQGRFEPEEHERLGHVLAGSDFKRIVLVGPRLRAHTKPIIETSGRGIIVESFLGPKDALDYILSALHGGEVLVFKGARFLEGIIEHLLEDEADAEKLCRREKIWQERRKKWGL